MSRGDEPTIHIVTVRSRSESPIVRRLRFLAGVYAYSPKFLSFANGDGVESPLFPGYMFVWCLPGQHRAALSVEGVFGFVRMGGAAVEVRPEIVESIRDMENDFGFIIFDPKFKAGQRVRVGGPDGAIGVVRSMRNHRQRVTVLLNILGRQVEMSVPENDLVAA